MPAAWHIKETCAPTDVRRRRPNAGAHLPAGAKSTRSHPRRPSFMPSVTWARKKARPQFSAAYWTTPARPWVPSRPGPSSP
eukprot:6448781-Pyramimonas_sp.AAC.1